MKTTGKAIDAFLKRWRTEMRYGQPKAICETCGFMCAIWADASIEEHDKECVATAHLRGGAA